MQERRAFTGVDQPHASLPPLSRAIDYRELRRLISIRDVLELIRWQPAKARGAHLRGPCPVHKSSQETSTLFVVNTERNIWYCHSPKCKTGGNQLDLWMRLAGLSLYDAAVDLCQRTGRDVPWLT